MPHHFILELFSNSTTIQHQRQLKSKWTLMVYSPDLTPFLAFEHYVRARNAFLPSPNGLCTTRIASFTVQFVILWFRVEVRHYITPFLGVTHGHQTLRSETALGENPSTAVLSLMKTWRDLWIQKGKFTIEYLNTSLIFPIHGTASFAWPTRGLTPMDHNSSLPWEIVHI